MRRAPLAALLALAACSSPIGDDCPGAQLVGLALRGVRDDAHTGCAVAPASGWVVPATLPDVAPTADDPTPTFHASFRQLDGDRIAYCAGNAHAAVLFGTRTGDVLDVQQTLSGAVLGACAATCQPQAVERVTGTLTAGVGGAPATFTGTLTETFEGSAGSCGACQLPCTSTYALTGTAE